MSTQDIISKVYISPEGKEKNILGYANIVINSMFMIKNIRIVKGRKGVFLGMPSNKNKKGEYVDIFFPTNQASREYLTHLIVSQFQAEYPELMEGIGIYSVQKDYVSFESKN